MDTLIPWVAVAGVGALHGLNPASGWMLAAAWGVRKRDLTHALRALAPIAVGHAASVALVGFALVFSMSMDRMALQILAGALLAVVALLHLSGRMPRTVRAPAGHVGLALWSFMMSTAHGAGLMLVPALVPLCMGSASPPGTTEPNALLLALAAIGVHTVAMLSATGVIAAGVCFGVDRGVRLFRGPKQEPPPLRVDGC